MSTNRSYILEVKNKDTRRTSRTHVLKWVSDSTRMESAECLRFRSLFLERKGGLGNWLDYNFHILIKFSYCNILGFKFPFFIVRMPYLTSSISTSSSIFYGSKFPWITWCTLRVTDFMPKPSQLYTRMVTRGRNKASILPQIKKAFQKYPEPFSKYCKSYDKIINESKKQLCTNI